MGRENKWREGEGDGVKKWEGEGDGVKKSSHQCISCSLFYLQEK